MSFNAIYNQAQRVFFFDSSRTGECECVFISACFYRYTTFFYSHTMHEFNKQMVIHTLALFRTEIKCTPKVNTQTNSNVDWRPVDCIGPKIVAKCRLIFFSRARCFCCCAYSYCFMMYFHQSILRLHGFTRQPKGRKCVFVLT